MMFSTVGNRHPEENLSGSFSLSINLDATTPTE
jgi:hypothetical protein